MSVYVDELVTYPLDMIQPIARRWGRSWCHLTADTLDELHAFADRLGLRRTWFQDHSVPHYDLLPSKRALALAMGALFKSAREQARERLRGSS